MPPEIPGHHGQAMSVVSSTMRCARCGHEMPPPAAGEEPPLHCGIPMELVRGLRCAVCDHETTALSIRTWQ